MLPGLLRMQLQMNKQKRPFANQPTSPQALGQAIGSNHPHVFEPPPPAGGMSWGVFPTNEHLAGRQMPASHRRSECHEPRFSIVRISTADLSTIGPSVSIVTYGVVLRTRFWLVTS